MIKVEMSNVLTEIYRARGGGSVIEKNKYFFLKKRHDGIMPIPIFPVSCRYILPAIFRQMTGRGSKGEESESGSGRSTEEEDITEFESQSSSH